MFLLKKGEGQSDPAGHPLLGTLEFAVLSLTVSLGAALSVGAGPLEEGLPQGTVRGCLAGCRALCEW